MQLSLLLLASVFLSACTFGVPMGGGQSSAQSSIGKTSSAPIKRNGPSSYVVFGKRYYVMESSKGFTQRGKASWYGKKFHGKPTATGEIYNMHAMTAAHKTLPLPVYVRVKNLENGRSIVVKVNDRGPFVGDRIIDLSYAAASKLKMIGPGTAEVEVSALDSATSTTRPAIRVIPLKEITTNHGDIYIQLGSFSSEINALNLVAALKAINEKSISVSTISTSKGEFFRVRLGPLLDVSEASSIQKRLMRKGYNYTRIVIDG